MARIAKLPFRMVRSRSPFDGGKGPMFWLTILVLFLACAYSPFSAAQVSASLSGMITDPLGAAISAASVTVKNLDTGASRVASTDQGGRYRFFALAVGPYEISVTKTGFALAIRSGIRLVVGQDATVDLGLRVGQVSEQIKVVEDSPVVNLTTQDISGLVGEQQVKDLPLNGRSYRSAACTLNPGIVNFTWEKTGGIGVSNSTTANNFSVSGNRPQQNMFLLNGVEFTGAAENNMQPGGTSGQLLGVDAVREFNVLRDSYGAEYGKRPGGASHASSRNRGRINFTALSSSSCATMRSMRPTTSIGVGAALPAQSVRRVARRTDPGEQDIHFRQLRGISPEPASDVGDICPATTLARHARRQRSASAEPLAAIAAGVRAPDFNVGCTASTVWCRAGLPGFQQPATERYGRISARRASITLFPASDTLAAVYTIDDGNDLTATVFDPYSTDILTLREQVFSIEETHTFSPISVEYGAVWLLARRLFLHRRTHARNTGCERSRLLWGIRSARSWWAGAQRRIQPAQLGLAGSNNGSNLTIAAICSPTRIA